jgi:uncharacterized surface protein with fasciclin (FAS1) repeats
LRLPNVNLLLTIKIRKNNTKYQGEEMRVMRRTAIAVVAVAAALTLSACSSSSDEATTAESSAAVEESAIAEADEMVGETSPGTIVEVASANPDFSTLVAAVSAAGLVETLSGEGPFTVFAPTNEAFAALPAGVLDALLLPENKDALVKILTYHVVPGTVLAADIKDGDVATVEGQNVTLSTANGVTVNGATVLTADVLADNGVIHVIDAVLVPADVDVAALTMP